MPLYKQKTISKKIVPSTFSIADLESISKLSEELNEEFINQFKLEIKTGQAYISDSNLNRQNEDEVNRFIEDNYKLLFEIHSADGSYVNFLGLDEINHHDIPKSILTFKISNYSMFNYLKSYAPSSFFEIQLDFTDVKVFDFSSYPSYGTPNNSYFTVKSSSHTFCDGVSSRLGDAFIKKKNLFPILHYPEVYDFTLYIFVIPTTTAIVYLLNDKIPETISQLPVFLQLLAVASSLFLLLMTYRLIFNSGRKLLPFLEILEEQSKSRTVLKYIYGAAVTGLIGTITYNFIASIIKAF